MSSFSAALPPVGVARTVEAPTGPRHLAPESPSLAESAVADVEAAEARPGRHAEPEWSRELFDPARDSDPFEWLGFTAPTG